VVDASYAGLGLIGTLREALAVETPVIGTRLQGVPALIADGETGLLVPPRNPDALAPTGGWRGSKRSTSRFRGSFDPPRQGAPSDSSVPGSSRRRRTRSALK
jgi:glycosyltransferase involved in cell wall biosynthesis